MFDAARMRFTKKALQNIFDFIKFCSCSNSLNSSHCSERDSFSGEIDSSLFVRLHKISIGNGKDDDRKNKWGKNLCKNTGPEKLLNFGIEELFEWHFLCLCFFYTFKWRFVLSSYGKQYQNNLNRMLFFSLSFYLSCKILCIRFIKMHSTELNQLQNLDECFQIDSTSKKFIAIIAFHRIEN